MPFALLLALIAIAGGALVTYLFDEDAPLAARLCMGACIGFAALGLFGFVLASFLGLGSLALILYALLLSSPWLLLVKREWRKRLHEDVHEAVRGVRRAVLHPTRHANVYVVFYALLALMLWLVFDRAMVEAGGGIYTGVMNNYGDLPFHLSIITSFSDGANFPPEDPTFAGARLTYPFIADFVAACFARAGASLRQAMFLENFVLALSFVGLLHRFTVKLVHDRLAGLIAPLLVLFSGGLGWWHFFKDSEWSERGIFGVLLNVRQLYTDDSLGYSWGNSLTTLLVTQRSLLLGLPLAIIVFTIWWTLNDAGTRGHGDAERKKKPPRLRISASPRPVSPRPRVPAMQRMALAGAVAGLLPLVHAHTFMVVMVVGGGVALLTGLKEWRAWAAFFIAAIVIAAPQMWWATRASAVRAGSFIGWQPGWDMKDENFFWLKNTGPFVHAILAVAAWAWFWLKNTGLFIPLLVAAFLWRGPKSSGEKYLLPRRLLLFYLPFTICFVVPNLIKLAPWPWDNIKVIFYWFVASVPLVALLLARLLREKLWLRSIAVVLILSLTLAGALDVWGVLLRTTEYEIFDAQGVGFAEMVKERTAPRSTILHAPTFNTPIFLTGRRSVIGYPGHIESHGIEYLPRLREVERIYAGESDAENLISKYGIEYVVVGPHERDEMGKIQKQPKVFTNYQLIGEKGDYRLYKIARP